MSGRAIAIGAALALLFAATWVGLTAATGKTYHVAPLVIAAAPGWALRWWHEAAGRPLSDSEHGPTLAAIVGVGVIAVAAGWLAIAATGSEPIATILPDQPGGVPGEVVFFTLLGLYIAARNVARTACRSRPWAAFRRASD